MSITGIPEEAIKETLQNVNQFLIDLKAKMDAAIVPSEIRGLVQTLNQTAANLQVVSEKLMRVVEMLK